jgi:Ca-activated chloride channel family protein
MDFTNPHFAEPRWLWLAILACAALIVLHRYAAWSRRRDLRLLAGSEITHRLLHSHSPRKRLFKETLLVIAVAAIGIALARPQWGEQTEVAETMGQDILFLIDCSQSMMAGDVRPNRLTRSKYAVIDFVQKHGQGRVGLVAFAGQAFLLCPLTYDYDAFREAVTSLDDHSIPVSGTDIGRALDEAFLATEKLDRRKIMVLLTDGEDLQKTGIEQARKLSDKEVQVFTIGIGTTAGSQIQTASPQGVPDLVKDSSGKIVVSRLDEESLRAIAQVTHATYQPLGPLGEGMTKVLLSIRNPSKPTYYTPTFKYGVDRFHLPVALVILLLVMESLLGTRRRMRIRLPHPTLILLMTGILYTDTPLSAATNDSPEPHTPREFYNVGTRQLNNTNLNPAESLLQAAVASNDPRIQPPALFNLGHTRFRQGVEALKEIASGQVADKSRTALDNITDTLKSGRNALESKDMDAIIAAYRHGRGTRKELKSVTQVVKRAMDTHSSVLLRWQRASGDFKSAFELNPVDTAAKNNGDWVDSNIAQLIDMLQREQNASMALKSGSEKLKRMMADLKKRLPEDSGEGKDDGGDEEEENEKPKEPKKGDQEAPAQEGKEKNMDRDEAMRLIESLKLDANRKLPMGMEQTGTPKDNNGRNW